MLLTLVHQAPVGPNPVLWQLPHPLAITALLVLLGLTFPLRGLILMIIGRKRGLRPSRASVVFCIVELLLGTALVCLARVSTLGLFIILETYLFCILAAKGIDCYLYAKSRQWRFFVPAAAITACGTQLLLLLLAAPPVQKQRILLVIAVLMLAVFGASMLCDLLFFLVKSSRFRRIVNNIRIALPDYVSLPLLLHVSDAACAEPLASVPPDTVEVLFQVSPRGIGMAGHCELCIDGRTLTYGCYEPGSRRFFRSMGRGVVFRAPREAYLGWMIHANQKKIVSYVLRFPPEQMQMIRQQLAQLERNMERWLPQESGEEFVTRLQQVPQVEFYRLTGGPFRTYFVPTINCVTITNSILARTELGNARMPGVRTPGAYMDMLDRQYRSGSRVIIDRRVYGEKEEARSV